MDTSIPRTNAVIVTSSPRRHPNDVLRLGPQLILGQDPPEAYTGERSTEHNHEHQRAYQD